MKKPVWPVTTLLIWSRDLKNGENDFSILALNSVCRVGEIERLLAALSFPSFLNFYSIMYRRKRESTPNRVNLKVFPFYKWVVNQNWVFQQRVIIRLLDISKTFISRRDLRDHNPLRVQSTVVPFYCLEMCFDISRFDSKSGLFETLKIF